MQLFNRINYISPNLSNIPPNVLFPLWFLGTEVVGIWAKSPVRSFPFKCSLPNMQQLLVLCWVLRRPLQFPGFFLTVVFFPHVPYTRFTLVICVYQFSHLNLRNPSGSGLNYRQKTLKAVSLGGLVICFIFYSFRCYYLLMVCCPVSWKPLFIYCSSCLLLSLMVVVWGRV